MTQLYERMFFYPIDVKGRVCYRIPKNSIYLGAARDYDMAALCFLVPVQDE